MDYVKIAGRAIFSVIDFQADLDFLKRLKISTFICRFFIREQRLIHSLVLGIIHPNSGFST